MSKQTKDQAVVLSALEEDLLTLLYDRRLYGLEFINAIKEASKGTRELGVGSLYPTLARLEKNKLVIWHWGDEQVGPRRKYYEITPFGKMVLENTWRFREALRVLPVEPKFETVYSDKDSVNNTQSLSVILK
jgi:PadR family transcriptional regulator PadR